MILPGAKLPRVSVCETPKRTPIADTTSLRSSPPKGPTATVRTSRRLRPADQATGDPRTEASKKISAPPLRATLVSELEDGSVTSERRAHG